ncbi:MAG: AraC family transcriptional regulator [Clostridiales bacterium]|nr:AraC family transcriptional regulator [Clostridiales bacterium]
MINKLLSDIEHYIEYLEENKIYVSIHTTFTEYMLPLLKYNLHKNPKCLLVKSENEEWDKCIKQHEKEEEKITCRICHAGVEELIFPLECGGTLCISTEEKLENLCTVITPLCRMIEYLIFICPDDRSEITDNELVNRAIKFIQRNFYNKISNNDIADFCSCSVSSLCHLFKKIKGMSVHRYICGLRISYAEELLKTSNLSVTSIAGKSGFSDYNYFALTFRKETGISPSQYRKNTKTG